MLVKPDERLTVARLLGFLELGERLARDCALAQVGLAPEAGMRRFLRGQARQESYHGAVFGGAAAWLAKGRLGVCPMLKSMDRYRTLLDAAIRRGDFAETLVAQQIVLEGLGEAILRRIEVGLVKRRAGFGPLRRILIHQEEAHHAFGHRTLTRLLMEGKASQESLRSVAQKYVSLSDHMLGSVGDLLESIDEDPAGYQADAKRNLPDWILSGDQPSEPGFEPELRDPATGHPVSPVHGARMLTQ